MAFTGTVLPGALIAPSNAVTTGEPDTGVVRDPGSLPQDYTLINGVLLGEPPDFVDPWADQYRAAILEAPGTAPVEYLVWAQNTSQLAIGEDSSWWSELGTGTIPLSGTLTVGSYQDGTDRVLVADDGNRSLGRIYAVVVSRGDVTDYDDEGWKDPDDVDPSHWGGQPRKGLNPYLTLYFETDEQDPYLGIATLTAAHLTLLGNGLSNERGDQIEVVHYTVSASRFWWTRNDRYEQRFGWKESSRRWEPYKGQNALSLGTLLFNVSYKLVPWARNLPVNAYLPGSVSVPDSYAPLRLGTDAGAQGLPIDHVRVKADNVVETFDFSTEPSANAVVGQGSGILVFNPAYLELNIGKTIWYSPKNFSSEATGIVGKLLGSNTNLLYITPVPGPTDRPLIRLGSRKHLTPVLFDTEADLILALPPSSGEVYVALSTGRLKFNQNDVDKSDPTSSYWFDLQYLDVDVIYDGLALCGEPQPVKRAVPLLDALGAPGTATSSQLFIPDAVGLPNEFVSPDLFRGLGRSGILDAPDETGAVPAYPLLPASLRPGGDSIAPGTQNPGRIRQVEDGVADTLLYSQQGAIENLILVDTNAEFPRAFQVPKGTAYISRYRDTFGSEVLLGSANQQKFGSKPVYFLQSSFMPATVTQVARIFSKSRDIFRFEGTEILYFAIDGVYYAWNSSTLLAALPNNLFFTPTEVAASIQTCIDTLGADPWTGAAVIPGPGLAYEKNGRVVLESANPATGSVEIGYGTSKLKDLSGSSVLGFLPGWRVVGGVTCWLPDSGVSLGLVRSPINLARNTATPDANSSTRIEDVVLQSSIQGNPFIFLNQVPLQDVAGFEDGVFFSLATSITDGDTTQLIQKPLQNYVDVVYRFGQRKFDWVLRESLAGVVDQTLTTLNLGKFSVVPESMLGAPGIGGGLYVAEDGGAATLQSQADDYVLPQDGGPGNVQLVTRYGSRVLSGAQGMILQGGNTLTDNSVNFTSVVQLGYRVKLTSSDSAGSYKVLIAGTNFLTVTPAFPAASALPVSWELFEGFTEDVYDPTIVADVVYQEFNHLQAEPFQVRQLSRLGLTPATAVDQASNRLKANIAGAVASGRLINLRFKLETSTVSNTATLTPLATTSLGAVANGLLVVPDTTSVRFTSGAFSIWVGTSNYIPVGVASFSADPVGVEYLTAVSGTDPIGRLKFNSTVLADHAAATVFYGEEFLDPSDLVGGQAEYNPNNGLINLSSADMATHVAEQAYFVEQLVTEGRKDVSISPMSGSFSPNQPVPVGATVETSYWAADLEGRKVGNQITEFLSVFIRDEVATLLSPNVYLFNTTGNLVDTFIEPVVYIGSTMQNFGHTDYLLDYPANLGGQGKLTFIQDILPSTTTVKVTYAVYEAQGGERAFEASQKNLYRPPFFIKAAQNQFGLRGDRVSEFQVGQLLRLGEDCFYIRSLLYYPPNLTTGKGDVTAIGIFPSTVNEVGSRAPGNDVLTLVTPGPYTTLVDPDGVTPVPTTAPIGLMSLVDITLFPFEPVSAGQKTIIFRGDLTTFAVAGHLLELSGCPYTIGNVEQTSDGSNTKITVTGGFNQNYSVDTSPTVKLSYRPIYPPESRDFLGVGPVLESESFELVLYGETLNGVTQPGRTLLSGVDYNLDTATGKIRLVAPLQGSLQPNQSLQLSFTKVRALQPYLQNGMPVIPRYFADFLYGALPDEQNGLLGGQLQGTYTFANPDSFYFRAVRLAQFMGEAAQEAVAEISNKQPAGGPLLPSGGSSNWQYGRFGLSGEQKRLYNKDRVARTFLDFYNSTIQGFEQVLETIDGRFIGDRDGKFRFWVGYGKDYPTPGYEDSITGMLTPRNLWNETYSSSVPANTELTVLTTDWVVEPKTVTLVSDELVGTMMDPSRLGELLNQQRIFIKNDIDDVLLVHLGRAKGFRTSIFPYYAQRAKGVFASCYEPHQFSRLFPTQTRAFLRTDPGVGSDPDTNDPGVYTWGRVIDGHQSSTRGKTIGQLSNPVLDAISQVHNVTLSRRRARARVWGYFPNGIPAGVYAGAINVPCLVAVVTPLSEVLVNPDTGYPDETVFLSQGGDVPDLTAGDPEMVLPGFVIGDQLNWGQPDGLSYPAFSSVTDTINTVPVLTGLFVCDVLYGCVLTFQDKDGTPIGLPSGVLVGIARDQGVQADAFPISMGDTLYVGALTGGNKVVNDPPKLSDLQTILLDTDTYRTGVDFSFKVDGSLVDRTLPSIEDPTWFALKEWTAQSPPEPLSTLQGTVEFGYDSANPLVIPALLGGLQDDSGDYQIPYLRANNTELDRLGGCSQGLSVLLSAKTPFGDYIYPNEILGNDGSVNSMAGTLPATLITSADIFPGIVTFGTGDVAPYDLLLMQTEVGDGPFTTLGGAVQGPQGFLTIGDCASIAGPLSLLEPPRFVAQTKVPSWPVATTGDLVRYQLNNAMVYMDNDHGGTPQVPPLPDGVIIRETATEIILTFSSVGLELTSDGVTVGLGNLNDLIKNVAGLTNNVLTIEIYSRPDGGIAFGPGAPFPSNGGGSPAYCAMTIYLTGSTARFIDYFGGDSGWVASAPIFGAPGVQQIYIPKPAPPTLFDWGPGGGTPDQWFLPYDVTLLPAYQTLYGLEFSISLSTRNPGQSETAWIAEDRLTFNEVCDLSFAKPRGFVHPLSGLPLETRLVVYECTVGLTAGTEARCNLPQYANGLDGLGSPIPFTFVPRTDAVTVGFWQPRSPGTNTLERGRLKVMGFEGYNNTPITTVSPATFSAVPSSIRDEVGYICRGSGKTGSRFNTDIPLAQRSKWDNRIVETSLTDGAESRVEPGDILVIKSSTNANHPATVEAGTYLVRHAVEATPLYSFRQVTPTTVAGQEKGWCPLHFPTTVAFNSGTNILTISDLAPALGGAVVNGKLCGFSTNYAGIRRVSIIRNLAGLASTDATIWKNSVISARYMLITSPGASDLAYFTLTDYRDANSTVLTAAQFAALLDKPYPVSGMRYWPVNVSGAEYGLPANNCVGFDSDGVLPAPGDPYAVYGFHWFTMHPPSPLYAAEPLLFGGNAVLPVPPLGVPQAYPIRKATAADTVVPSAYVYNTVPGQYLFQADPTLPVYPWVVHNLYMGNLTDARWNELNIPTGSYGDPLVTPAITPEVNCVLPGTTLTLGNEWQAVALAEGPTGFWAQSGIFLEPSVPRTCLNLDAVHAHVVDASHSLSNPVGLNDWDRELGMRNLNEYDPTGAGIFSDPDEVNFEVRRIRRFHDVGAETNFQALRYVYEIRRGFISSYSTSTQQRGLVEASQFYMTWVTPAGETKARDAWSDGTGPHEGTNLGPFTSEDVNIHPGDHFRLLGDSGQVLDSVEISSITNASQVKLAPPGLTYTDPLNPTLVGYRFEVYLQQAPVPHEQSNEQLLEMITSRVVTSTDASWADLAGEKGGYVPDLTTGSAYPNQVNKLCDDQKADGGSNTFAALGVRKGDIVVVDPVGKIPQVGGLPAVPEQGVRPLGDLGVSVRAEFAAKSPDRGLDDNRGYYRVLQVVDSGSPKPYLLVDPISTYTGAAGTPVVFDPTSVTQAYAVYPSVTDSLLQQVPYTDPGVGFRYEGQQDLRPTRLRDAVTKSFRDRGDAFIGHSIRPFSYKIIRPSGMFSEEAVDLVLTLRERMLSQIELLQSMTTGFKTGTYFIFQRDEHCGDLGDILNPLLGMGLPSNAFINLVQGQLDTMPYLNNEGCLSLLDRRFWILDSRLDSLTYDPTTGNMKLVGLGDTPYTAFNEVTGSKVRPVEPDRITDVLDNTDQFRSVRYVWLSYRVHKTLGTLASISLFEDELPKRLAEQKKVMLLKASLESV